MYLYLLIILSLTCKNLDDGNSQTIDIIFEWIGLDIQLPKIEFTFEHGRDIVIGACNGLIFAIIEIDG